MHVKNQEIVFPLARAAELARLPPVPAEVGGSIMDEESSHLSDYTLLPDGEATARLPDGEATAQDEPQGRAPSDDGSSAGPHPEAGGLPPLPPPYEEYVSSPDEQHGEGEAARVEYISSHRGKGRSKIKDQTH